MDKIEQLKEFINESRNIVFFTGAGISCASGIPDFRSENGLYNQSSKGIFTPEEIISHSFFYRYPEDFFKFYFSKMIYPSAKPNLAHIFIAKLAQYKNVTVITQNIDGLHSEAGSKNVLELHGSIYRNYCVECNRFYKLNEIINQTVPHCDVCGGIIKPDVVLYEEGLDDEIVLKAVNAIRKADCLIIIGTSLTVYPAASYIRFYHGNKMVLINKQSTPFDSNADLVFNDDVINVFSQCQGILNEELK